MQLIKNLFKNGFTLNDAGKQLRPDIHVLIDASDEPNQILEVLDKTVFNALKIIYPGNRLIRDLDMEYQAEQSEINNDGFNTIITNDKFAELKSSGGLLAPNGKQSLLTKAQYKTVRTPEFKAWFGDWENDPKNASQIVDKNGDPLVMYHGGGFNGKGEFKGWGWFTSSKYDANHYSKTSGGGNLTAAFLNVRKPFYSGRQGNEFYETNAAVQIAIKKGNDGVIDMMDKVNILDTVVFNSNQIKLQNNTTFDPKNVDVRFEIGGEITRKVPADLDTDLGVTWGKKFKDGTVIVAHGTSSNLLPLIYKNGLIRGSEKSWDNSSDGKLFFETEPTFTYYGNNVYAWKSVQKNGGVPVVLYVKVDKNKLKADHDDADLGPQYQKRQKECSCDIPAEDIIGIRVFGRIDIKRDDFIEFADMFKDEFSKFKGGGTLLDNRKEAVINAKPNDLVTLYHAAPAKYPIIENGIKTSTGKNFSYAKSGLVYLAVTPELAYGYAKMSSNGELINVYEVKVPKRELLPDSGAIKSYPNFTNNGIKNNLTNSINHFGLATISRPIYASELSLFEQNFATGGEIDLSKMENFDFSVLFDNIDSSEQDQEEQLKMEANIEKVKSIVEKIDNKIAIEEESLRTWQSKSYKKNSDVVYTNGDDIHGTPMSIGSINEARKRNKIIGFQNRIEILNKAKILLLWYDVTREGDMYENMLYTYRNQNYLKANGKKMSSQETFIIDEAYGEILAALSHDDKHFKTGGELLPEINDLLGFSIDEFIDPELLKKELKPVAVPKVDKTLLQDYGEKIGGAKKDLLHVVNSITSNDLESLPLSKSFPPPDYKKLVDDKIITIDNAVLLKFMYDNIPTKPRKSYRIPRWVAQVQILVDHYRTMLSQDIETNTEFYNDYVDAMVVNKGVSDQYDLFYHTMIGLGFPEKNVNLGNYRIRYFKAGFRLNDKYEKEATPERYSIIDSCYIIKDYPTLDEAIAGLAERLNKPKTSVSSKDTVFSIYRDNSNFGIFIGKKGNSSVIRLMEGFLDVKAASEYLKTHQAEIQAIWDGLRDIPNERNEHNRSRVGVDWRLGKDITSEDFAKTFGFRGVEFGNWVNTAERQSNVNDAYDSLMDLASVLGISPGALSLSGQLGFAFGARGSGAFNAHYEPDNVVINLTKTRGSGSLAHEWWHSLDNYFSRMRGRKLEYITNFTRSYYGLAGKPEDSVREEILDAYKGVIDAINKSGLRTRSGVLDSTRSKPYWSTPVEMSARSFESFVIDKLAAINQQNDYLANFKEMTQWIRSTNGNIDASTNYPYPLDSERDAIDLAYQQFADTLKVKKNDQGREMLFEAGGIIKGKPNENAANINWYHGTTKEFTNLSSDNLYNDLGIFLTSDKELANEYTKLTPFSNENSVGRLVSAKVFPKKTYDIRFGRINKNDILSVFNALIERAKKLDEEKDGITPMYVKFQKAKVDLIAAKKISDWKSAEAKMYDAAMELAKREGGYRFASVAPLKEELQKLGFDSIRKIDDGADTLVILDENIIKRKISGGELPVKLYRGVDSNQINETYGGVSDDGIGVFYTDNKLMAECFAGLKIFDGDTGEYESTGYTGGKVLEFDSFAPKNSYIIDSSHPDYEIDYDNDSVQIYFDQIRAASGVEKYKKGLQDKGFDGIILKENTTNYYEDGTYDVYIDFNKSFATGGEIESESKLIGLHFGESIIDEFSDEVQLQSRKERKGYTTDYGDHFVFPKTGHFFFIGEYPTPHGNKTVKTTAILNIKNPLDLTKTIPPEDTAKIIDFVKTKINKPPTPGEHGSRISVDSIGGIKKAKQNGIEPQQLMDFINDNFYAQSKGQYFDDIINLLGKDGVIFYSNSAGTSLLEKQRGPGDGKTYKVAVAIKASQITVIKETGGELTEKELPDNMGTGYDARVTANLNHIGSKREDWRPVPIKGFALVEGPKGKMIEMPEFDFPKGYARSKTLYKNNQDNPCCELCGKEPIKKYYYIQNDKEQTTMITGSECVTHFGEGKSGKENLRAVKINLAIILDQDLYSFKKFIKSEFSKLGQPYGWSNKRDLKWSSSYLDSQPMDEFAGLLNPKEIERSKNMFAGENAKYHEQTLHTINWGFVHQMIPVFSWSREQDLVKRNYESQETAEKNLLTWFKKNEHAGRMLLEKVSEILRIIGKYDENVLNSDYLSAVNTVGDAKIMS